MTYRVIKPSNKSKFSVVNMIVSFLVKTKNCSVDEGLYKVFILSLSATIFNPLSR